MIEEFQVPSSIRKEDTSDARVWKERRWRRVGRSLDHGGCEYLGGFISLPTRCPAPKACHLQCRSRVAENPLRFHQHPIIISHRKGRTFCNGRCIEIVALETTQGTRAIVRYHMHDISDSVLRLDCAHLLAVQMTGINRF